MKQIIIFEFLKFVGLHIDGVFKKSADKVFNVSKFQHKIKICSLQRSRTLTFFNCFQCLVDSDWLKVDDDCARNPKFCKDGLTLSVWEKNTFDSSVMVPPEDGEFPRKYLVSSGATFDRDTGFATPGFAIYRQVICSFLEIYIAMGASFLLFYF